MNSVPPMPLQALDLAVTHPGRPPRVAVQGLNLCCRPGEWLAVVGPNGAGKSTMLRCLAGLMPAAAGQVLLHGRPLAAWSDRARAQALSWLGQDPPGEEAMSVLDTVALGRMPHQRWLGWTTASQQDGAVVAQALVDTDMAWAAAQPLGALSGGERQRVHLARALAVAAPILLLDEPMAHLDAPHQRLLALVLRREARRGRSVVSVLHELSLALAADRLAVMHQGRVVAQGPANDASVHRAIEEVFDHSVVITHVNDRWVALPRL